jgi:bifunctional non-homologous end joining protein LigD
MREDQDVDVTNPDKTIFPEPGYSKSDLVGYYATVADRMVPWLTGRPLTLERYPDGVAKSGFMQKNASRHFSDRIDRVEVPKSDGIVTHPVVSDADGLVELANQGTVTFHVWTAALPELDQPTHLVLDLDPEAGDLEEVRQVARQARTVLDRFGMDGALVASGKKGFHIWVPVSGADYDGVGAAARAIAGIIAIEHPELATVEFLKKNRKGRVFIDWLRNRRAQSIVSPWSLRPTPLANVAMPLDWSELDGSTPDGWNLRTAPDRPTVAQPEQVAIDVDGIVSAARTAGADIDTEFDRFGRS